MDQLLPCRGSSAARRRWCHPAARPSSALAIAGSVAAALLLAVVLFGVRLTPSGGNHTSWVFDGGRDVLKSGPLATVPDPRDRTLGGLLSPDFNDSSCLSRYRAMLYRRPSLHAISSHLISTLRRYESLHRQCGPGTPAYARAVERLRAAPNASTTPPSSSSSDCSYLVWNPVEGLGNRILSITSGFLYALLTGRVLLLHSSGGDLDDLFCEPFAGSTWILPKGDKDDFPIRDMEQLGQGHHESLGAVLGRGEDPGAASPWLYAHLVHNYDAQDRRFFCDDAQAALRRVPWLVFHSDNYFAPGLFLIPGEHERELSRMFPRRDLVFHHLGRYLFHPSNTVWGMVMRYHDEYFAKADERVGIQVRTFGWAPISADELYGQILKCTQRENILPVPNSGEVVAANADGGGQPAKRKAVVVVSLHGEYSEKLRETYQKENGSTTAAGREAVSVYQPTHLGAQRSGEKEHNQQAFAEMVLLGFSDAVVTTAASTFGYVGQGLAGLRPWVLMSPVDEKAPDTPCRHAPTTEPCFHSPPNYDCRAKAEGDTGRMVRHIRHCEDFPQGVQLVE